MGWSTSPLAPGKIEIEMDGIRMSGTTARLLFPQYTERMASAGRRLLPGWEDRLWGAMADKYPKYVHRVLEKDQPGVSIATAASFMKFLAARITNPRDVVPEAEARRRAAICMSCPMRTNIVGCSKCKAALKMLVIPPIDLRQGLGPDAEVPPGCLACGCWMKAKVWIHRHQLGSAEEFPFDPGCWMFEGRADDAEAPSA